MCRVIEDERKRLIETVLPRRFTLDAVDLHPLALEYLVRVPSGGTH
jgi:hypothetical protein